jgi:iron complex outermembrane receptor protein
MLRTSLARAASLTTIWTIGLAGPAVAAEASAPAGTVEEIVVTAQKVQQDNQRVPVAVTAFTAERLRESHVETLADIAEFTPSFTAGVFNPAELNLTIRGIGSAEGVSQNAGGDPSVDVFVDGVYAGRGGVPDLDAFDLQRVEVLGGPQGTLFGKNAIGGLVQFISVVPSDKTSWLLSATGGNYGTYDVYGRANVPLNDRVFFAGGLSYKHHDGYEFNETTGHRVDDENLFTAQGAFRFLIDPNLEFILGADYTHQRQAGQPRHNICDASLAGGVHCVGVNPDPRVVDAYTDGYIRRDLATVRGELNWTTPVGVVTSLTAYRHANYSDDTPFFSNPVNPPNQIESTEIDDEHNSQFSEELRLAFHALDNRLDGVLGFYYLREDNNRTETLIQQFFLPVISGTAAYPQHVIAESKAVFGQADFKILPTLTATAGLRMTWEDKSGSFAGFVVSAPTPASLPPPLSGPYNVSASDSWSALTPHFGLEWQATPSDMLYFTATRGFKSGGYQGIAGSGPGAAQPYNPEYAWSYEVGAKTQWFDNRLRLNLAAYYTDYSNLQFSQLIPLCCVVVGNAAQARVEGVEVEFVGKPTRDFQIDGSFDYLDAQYTSFSPTAASNYTGNYLPRSPKYKLALGAQYSHDIGPWLGTARVDYAYTTKYFFDPNNIATQTQPAYSLVNARVSAASPDGRYEVALWGKNLADKLIATYVTAFPLFGQTLDNWAPPRTFGVTVTVKR